MTDEKNEFCWKVFYKDFFIGAAIIISVILLATIPILTGYYAGADDVCSSGLWDGNNDPCGPFAYWSMGFIYWVLTVIISFLYYLLCIGCYKKWFIKKEECDEL